MNPKENLWSKIRGGKRSSGTEQGEETSGKEAIQRAWQQGGVLVTPRAAGQMMRLGIIKATRKCSHREGLDIPGLESTCDRPAVVICGSCGEGTCSDPWHTYLRFITLRGGSPFDTKGSKFFYQCESCQDFICVYCLSIEDEYPCDPSQVEEYPFRCPNCGGSARVVRVDNVDYAGAVEQMMDLPSSMLRLRA